MRGPYAFTLHLGRFVDIIHAVRRKSNPSEGDGKKELQVHGLPVIKEPPNPFTFADGSPVRTKEDWDRNAASS